MAQAAKHDNPEENMPLQSRAAVMTALRKTEIRQFDLPEIGPDAGWLRVEVNGICSSDWNMYNNDKPGPRILGHEMVGRIERMGPAAAYRWGVEEGDLVALEEYLPCGHCEYCRAGEIRSCMATDQRFSGGIRFGDGMARAGSLRPSSVSALRASCKVVSFIFGLS